LESLSRSIFATLDSEVSMNKSFAVASVIWFLLGCAVLATVVNRQLNPQHGETTHANQGNTHGSTISDRDSDKIPKSLQHSQDEKH
jgi:hypothetical protein